MKNLTSTHDLTAQDLKTLLTQAFVFQDLWFKKKTLPQILQNKFLALCFFEDSTRTRFSFEIAAKALGAQTLHFQGESSSINKGETLMDTMKTLQALGIDGAILHHSDDYLIDEIKNANLFSLINAGAGKNQHPSQALLDLMTLQEEFGDLQGLTIAISGDIKSSRVANSFMDLAKYFDMKIYLTGPEAFLPDPSTLPKNISISPLDDIIGQCDALMFLRIQKERHQFMDQVKVPYCQNYGLTQERYNRMKKHAIIMHPAPVNRDMEIMSHLVESQSSRIFRQMQNGVPMRMAILQWINS